MNISISIFSKQGNLRDIMKFLALDLGDVWVGSAISDPLGICCRPYQIIRLEELYNFLRATIKKEQISTIIIGHPKTCTGSISDQTRKIENLKIELEQKFIDCGNLSWILWDERLSSKRAKITMTKQKSGGATSLSNKDHAIAAAFILQSYLDMLAFMADN